ncbi:MAG: excinuclease ABC subunit A [Desulfobulbaceae bacterium]|nr:excinuclease ABC subunit A [Desulfobulbaceae bacterium]
MKKLFLLSFGAALFLQANLAVAADTLLDFSISEALGDPKVSEVLSEQVALYWGEQNHPTVKTKYGNFSASRRTNKLGKSKEEACRWAFASSVKALQERAIKEGGNAVVNITSKVKNIEYSSKENYQCLAGGMMVNVVFSGDIVTISE